MSKRESPGTGILCAQKRQKKLDSSDQDEIAEEQEHSMVESSLNEATLLSEKKTPMAGVIRRITVHNFMCHNHLDIKLGPHVNFIIGRNGSGKSAVITALVVGLGGKAGVTGRGRAIKNFVKTGKREAWVEVCLNNKGKDSYKHHLYGDKIIVKRKFSVDGASSYSIHSESGQHISDRRRELTHITDHFNIQVDNPISILNQDTSRNFLNSKSASDKFKFFMRATQLEQMNSDYEEAEMKKDCTRQDIECKSETLHKMEKEVEVWKSKVKSLTALSDLKLKVKKLKDELAWAIVAEKERGMAPLEKSLKNEESYLPRFVAKVDQAQKEEEESSKRHKDLEKEVTDCHKSVGDLEPLYQAKQKDVAAAKAALTPALNELRSLDRELRSARAECQQCEDRIEELRTTASRDYDAERTKREEQIAKLRKTVEETTSKQTVREHEMGQYKNNVTRGRTEIAAQEAKLKTINNKLREVGTNLRKLQAARSDRLQRFDHWMPEVIRRINASKRQFHKPPKGPLGACFELKDSKWALALECCLKGLVSSFVCHDRHDEKLLEEIFKDVCTRGRRPTIITCLYENKIHDVSRHKANTRDYPCVLDMVKSRDCVVVNTLIDQRSIENILLIEDSDTARDVMMRRPPQNARECFTLAGDQVFCHPTFRYYSSDKTAVRYLMADVQEQVNLLQTEEKRLQTDLEALEKEKAEKQVEVRKNEQLEKTCLTQLNRGKDSLSRLQFEIRELEGVEDPAPIDVTTLEEEVNDYNTRIGELQNKRHSVLEDKTRGEARLQEARASLEEMEAEIRQTRDCGFQLREKIGQAQAELETARNNHKHYSSKLKEQERKIKGIQKELECYKKDLESDINKALQICEPIKTRRQQEDIDNEIHQIEMRIAEEEREQGKEQVIVDTFHQKRDTFQLIEREMDQLRTFLKKLDEMMRERRIAYNEMRKLIANRTKYHFLMQMSYRSFTGKMNFDFEREILDILVSPGKEIGGPRSRDKGQGQGSAGQAECGDLKSLSGGERSFSTVCFILSLWEAMESPFRCLDEFDVFMDMVNRRISMDMMMEAADEHRNMQFIFLTPQDMSSVRKVKCCKIFHMPDPERMANQSTLSFTQPSQQ